MKSSRGKWQIPRRPLRAATDRDRSPQSLDGSQPEKITGHQAYRRLRCRQPEIGYRVRQHRHVPARVLIRFAVCIEKRQHHRHHHHFCSSSCSLESRAGAALTPCAPRRAYMHGSAVRRGGGVAAKGVEGRPAKRRAVAFMYLVSG